MTVEDLIAGAPSTALGRVEYFTNILRQDVSGEIATIATDELFAAHRMAHASKETLIKRPAVSRCGPCGVGVI